MRRRLRLFRIGLTAGLSGLMVIGCGGDDKPNPQEPGGDAGPDDRNQCTVAFAKPLAGGKLSTTDDLDGNCANGVQYDVEVATSMPDGTEAILSGGESQQKGTVSNGVVKFPNVSFPIGETKLSVQVGDSTCLQTTTITASCGNAPKCVITTPTISPTHPKLNRADNVAAPGNPFQAKIEVDTAIEEGRIVALELNGAPLSHAIVSNGKATWPGVKLAPDGDHKVKVTCTTKDGATSSDSKTFTVDTVAPDLVVSGAEDGQHFGPLDSVDPSSPDVKIRICGATTAADALNVKQGPPPNPKNFCVSIGTASPECESATKAASNGACVDIACPGAAPFDITATLFDEAGNDTSKTIRGVTCDSSSPSVQIVEPVDGRGSDVTTHILAANAAQPRRDQDASKPGAQYTVVACTDAADGKGTLMVGIEHQIPLTWNPTPVDAQPAQASDGCPLGLGYVMKFTNADLPDSLVDADGNLTAASRLAVDVRRDGIKGSSPAVSVWVDSQAPTLTAASPTPLCGASQANPATWTTDVELSSSVSDVSFAVTSSGVTKSYASAGHAGGKVKFENVSFEPGANEIVATATKRSGNTASLESPCTVQVGNPPVITWETPRAGQNLCAAGNSSTSCVADGNAATAGWQGDLKVRVVVDGSPAAAGTTVTFRWGSAEETAVTDENGIATLSGQSIDDNGGSGHVVPLTASVTVDGFGTGKATVSPIVDAERPQKPTNLAATVKERRQTSFRLAWTASHDGPTSAPAHSYDVRIARSSIDEASFEDAIRIPFTGTPASSGDADGIDIRDQRIETDYFFALAAVDRVGNRSDVVATDAPVAAKFNVTLLNSPDASGQEAFGYWIDGSGDLNRDGLSDLIVTPIYGDKVFAYFGAGGFSQKAPDVVFEGVMGFGASAIYAGDIDGDGREDVAISSPGESKVYVFKGRASWPSTLNASEADYVIDAGTTYADAEFPYFGYQLARLGDFDGDGVDDFAISAQFFDDGRGRVVIVRGKKSLPQTVSLNDAAGDDSIVLEGDPAYPSGNFGSNILGIGKFYGGTGNGIVVSAPWAAAASAGRVYAFRGGPGGMTKVISATSAAHSVDGVAANTHAGLSLGMLGPVGGAFGFAVGNPEYVSGGIHGNAYLAFGNASTGPFSSEPQTLTCSAATNSRDGFGNVTLGGGFSGRTTFVSLIGNGAPDLVLAGAREANGAARLYLFDGNEIASLPNPADAATEADVIVPLPAGWVGTSSFSSLLRDIDGDSYADIAIGDYNDNDPGRVAIFW